MAEPDEQYTLRAQYWLGHYTLALDKAKNASCKAMPPHLKNEQLVLRCYLGLKRIRFDLHQAVESPTKLLAESLEEPALGTFRVVFYIPFLFFIFQFTPR